MGRMAELAYEREQIEQEIAIARMEAEHDAIPNSLAESLEINKALRTQLSLLADSFERANSPRERNKERAIGFALGITASLIAALVWWAAISQWPVLKT
jgi:hypothetical protein